MSLSEKSTNTIQNLIDNLGERKTGVKLIDHFLTRISGLSSSDLGDTSIFADGLDEIESLLKDGDFEHAFMMAKETATNMLEDEGFGMGMDESKKKTIKITESKLRRIINKRIQEQTDIEELDWHGLQTNENLENLRDAIRKNKTVSVAFVKKDGSVRHMAVRRTLSAYVGSTSDKTDSQKNVEENNDIKRVIDINAYIKMLRDTGDKELSAKNAWRSINLRNVLGFMVSGHFVDLRDDNQIKERFGEEVYNSLTKSMVRSMESEHPQNPENDNNNTEEIQESKIIKITESQFDRLLKNIGKESIRNKRMLNERSGDFKDVWTYNDTVLTFFCAKFGAEGLKKLGFLDYEDGLTDIANSYIGSSKISLKQQMSNIEFLLTGGERGLSDYSDLQKKVFDEYSSYSFEDMLQVLEMIFDETDTEETYKRYLEILKRKQDEKNKLNAEKESLMRKQEFKKASDTAFKSDFERASKFGTRNLRPISPEEKAEILRKKEMGNMVAEFKLISVLNKIL